MNGYDASEFKINQCPLTCWQVPLVISEDLLVQCEFSNLSKWFTGVYTISHEFISWYDIFCSQNDVRKVYVNGQAPKVLAITFGKI